MERHQRLSRELNFPQRKTESTKLTRFISKLGAFDSLANEPSASHASATETKEIVVEQLDERTR